MSEEINDPTQWLNILEQQQNIINVCEHEYNVSNMSNKGLGSREKRIINKKSKRHRHRDRERGL